ncbi:MAG: hypothetical protein V4686_01185 [Patescibacteria group bacterium]
MSPLIINPDREPFTKRLNVIGIHSIEILILAMVVRNKKDGDNQEGATVKFQLRELPTLIDCFITGIHSTADGGWEIHGETYDNPQQFCRFKYFIEPHTSGTMWV